MSEKSKTWILTAEYHTHTFYSDGKSTMEDNVIAARNCGIKTIGISDHGYRHMGFGVSYRDYPKMKDEVLKLRDKYPDMEILLGVEANILDDTGLIDVDDYILRYVDYVMAGYHFGSSITKPRGLRNHVCNFIKPLKRFEVDYNTRALINAMKQNDLFILTHPGDKGDIDTKEVAKVAMETGTILEINTHHANLSAAQLSLIKDWDLKFSVGADAHRSEHIGNLEVALKNIREAGLSLDKVINLKED